MRQCYTLLLVLGLFSLRLQAQQNTSFWAPVSKEKIILASPDAPQNLPQAFHAYQLDYASLAAYLKNAPLEFTDGQPLLLDLPQAGGVTRAFRLWESPLMAPELGAKYPGIRSYAGAATDGSGATVRLGVGDKGFHAFVLEADGSFQSVMPFQIGQQELYLSYRLEDLPQDPIVAAGLRCGTDDADIHHAIQQHGQQPVLDRGGSSLVQLKTYRLAIAARGEYTVFHGGTKNQALAAINTALDFIRAIQEKDLGLRLELIANNDAVIFTDPATDPYTGNTVGDWMSQNPAAINPILGNTSYDLGHVFSQFITGDQVGVASGRACDLLTKARGCSSAPEPNAEYFFLVAAHEMCHQLSGSHTWSNCPPSEAQLAPGTAFEPGSGTTIMSYAGSCSGGNSIQNTNDAYYHIASILQVQDFIWQGDGNTCGGTVATTNNQPEVNISHPDNLYIPISTPFELRCTGSDPDGDVLSYCWEQYDLGPTTVLGAPSGNAPSFRSYKPVPNPSRTFPRIAAIAGNITEKQEVLPTYSRGLTFRVTVRDNHAGGGGQAWDQVKLQATESAGPFLVSSPNIATDVWEQGENRIVTWSVANTDIAPVNCKRVNIRLSTDGGFTFPITLATDQPNSGRCCVVVPNVSSNTARVRVEAADNVFFDISNANFKVGAPTVADVTFCPTRLYDTICLPGSYSTVISTNASLGFSQAVTFSTQGLPAGVTASISPNPVNPGSDAVLSLNIPGSQPEGNFSFQIIGVAGSQADTIQQTVAVYYNDFSGLSLKAPLDGESGQDRSPVLRWNGVANANTYEVQVATSPSFAAGTLVASKADITADSFKVPILLEKGQILYWRFRPANECGNGDWLGPFAFGVLVDVCQVFESNDVPKNISSNAVATVEAKITIPAGGKVSDVNITKVQGNHAFFKDLEMHLISPTGTDVLLFKDKCPGTFNFNFGFDDSKTNQLGCPPATNGTTYKPAELLGAINNQNAGGDWVLRVKDNTIGSGGSIAGFALELCSSTALNPPVLVNNKVMQIPPGTNKAVSIDLLKTIDANNTDVQLVYTLLTTPKHGQLQLFWTGAMSVGAQFTQADLNNNGLRYFDYGNQTPSDEFCFTVTDGEGGLIKDCFTIQPFPVSSQEASRSIDFSLSPNPASENIRLAFPEPLPSDTRVRLFDASGRLTHSQALAAGQVTALVQLSDLPKGLYTVVLENAEGTGVRKVVVQ